MSLFEKKLPPRLRPHAEYKWDDGKNSLGAKNESTKTKEEACICFLNFGHPVTEEEVLLVQAVIFVEFGERAGVTMRRAENPHHLDIIGPLASINRVAEVMQNGLWKKPPLKGKISAYIAIQKQLLRSQPQSVAGKPGTGGKNEDWN